MHFSPLIQNDALHASNTEYAQKRKSTSRQTGGRVAVLYPVAILRIAMDEFKIKPRIQLKYCLLLLYCRMEVPTGLTEVNLGNREGVWWEDVACSKSKEIWLVQVPQNVLVI